MFTFLSMGNTGEVPDIALLSTVFLIICLHLNGWVFKKQNKKNECRVRWEAIFKRVPVRIHLAVADARLVSAKS